MTNVRYELADGRIVTTLPEAMNSGLEFRKVYTCECDWNDPITRYEREDAWYARRRAETN